MTREQQQAEVNALVAVTQTMMRRWYTDDAQFSLGDVARCVARCATLFQFIEDDDRISCENGAIIEISKRWGDRIQ